MPITAGEFSGSSIGGGGLSGGGQVTESSETASPLYVRGNSYTVSPGVRCTAGYEFFNLLKDRAVTPTVTTYGADGTRHIENAFALVGGAFDGIPLGGLWPSIGQPGIHILDICGDDYCNTTTPSSQIPGVLSALQVSGIATCLQAILSIMSSTTRYEEPSSATNWTQSASDSINLYSGGECLYTLTQGASVGINVTVPASGIMYALTQTYDPVAAGFGNGSATWSIGSTVYGSVTGTQIFGAINSPENSSQFIGCTRVVKLVGLPVGSQTITVTKTDASASNIVVADAILAANPNPPLIIYTIDPCPPGFAYLCSSPPFTSPQSAIAVANKPLLIPSLEAVVAQFPNVFLVDYTNILKLQNPETPSPTTGGSLSYIDGTHPNDRGMRLMANILQTTIGELVASDDTDGIYESL